VPSCGWLVIGAAEAGGESVHVARREGLNPAWVIEQRACANTIGADETEMFDLASNAMAKVEVQRMEN
jgi:hypothetical protein